MPNPNIIRKVILPGGSAAFLPNQIANLGFWLESDFGVTFDGANAVSIWVDRSPNTYTLAQEVGANQPILTANEFGSRPGLIFDGVNDSLERSVANPFAAVQNFSCFVVCKSTTGTADENFFSMGDLGSGDAIFHFKGNGTTRNNSVTMATVRSGVVNVVAGGSAINDNIGRLLTAESDGVVWSLRINRVDQALSIPNGINSGEAPGDFTTLDNITIGVIRRLTDTFGLSNFGALLFYERRISTVERTIVENYLTNKYGI